MRKITETFADNSFEVETSNLFDTTLSIGDYVESLKLGKFKVIDQSFRTDGPSDVAKLIFTINKSYDKRTKSMIRFSIFGDYDKMNKQKGILVVRLKGTIETAMAASEGVATNALNDFYMKDIYKILIQRTKDHYTKVLKQVKKEFS
ncbi:hypothetical protein CL614_06355 [archaeon]|nr:hypothetical protein [archaeon]|tara:strand:- start:4763 stop:5203 length:441 start_codon:yes stop_codon:yes gene_type:complete